MPLSYIAMYDMRPTDRHANDMVYARHDRVSG